MAAAIAMPVLWIAAFSVLAALPALGRPELAERRATANQPSPTAAKVAGASPRATEPRPSELA
jgi:hypothetical protein